MLQWIRKNYFKIFKTAALMGVFLAAVLLLAAPSVLPIGAGEAQAQVDSVTEGVQVIEEPLGLPGLDIRVIIANIIRTVLGLIGLILIVLIMYAGYIWMTAGGNEEQITKAKAIIKNAIIGLVIVLAAYSIVIFVMRIFGVTFNQGDGNLNQPGTTNFVGSGALGRIIKDHYPMRDDKDIPRNTKIVITFKKPIKLDELVEDVSDDGISANGPGDGIFGNCITTTSFDWLRHCDRVKKVVVEGVAKLNDDYINIKRVDTDSSIADAVIIGVSSTPESADLPAGIYTIILKPITDLTDSANGGGYLGSATEAVKYSVRLGKNFKIDDPSNPNSPAFTATSVDRRYGGGANYYQWQFTCTTTLDLSPPTVTRVYPAAGKIIAKNSVIQIDFSEPVDPTGVQGAFTASGTYFAAGENVFLNSPHSSRPEGNFVLSNGYRTLEFTPTKNCGVVNACGNDMFCLPVCDLGGCAAGSPATDDYQLLLRSARVRTSTSFDSLPFSGIADLAGNALDSQPYGTVNSAPNTGDVFAGDPSEWEKPDNYFWQFRVEDKIDTTTPYLIRVHPGLDAGYVPVNEPLTILFSKEMRVGPMYNIELRENPEQATPLWKSARVSFDESVQQTTVNILHGQFLKSINSSTIQSYIPIVTSDVQDVNFNCFYPGKGPKENIAGLDTINSADCASTGTCCEFPDAINSKFCCNGQVSANASTTASCIANGINF